MEALPNVGCFLRLIKVVKSSVLEDGLGLARATSKLVKFVQQGKHAESELS